MRRNSVSSFLYIYYTNVLKCSVKFFYITQTCKNSLCVFYMLHKRVEIQIFYIKLLKQPTVRMLFKL